MCVTVPNFVQIGQAVAEIWPFIRFSRWRPSAILDFRKLRILTAHTHRSANMRHLAKFCVDRSRRCGDNYGYFLFFNMAAVRHVGCVMHLFGPLT